jgi:hypothetical protein
MGDSHPAAIAGRTAPPGAAPEQPAAAPVPGNATSLTTGSTTPSEGATYMGDLKD